MKQSPLRRKTPLKSKGKTLKAHKRIRAKPKSTGMTAEHEARNAAIHALGVCIPCWLNERTNDVHGFAPVPPGVKFELHHPADGGRRIGHHFSYGCCLVHHQGDVAPGCSSRSETVAKHGPSIHGARRKVYAAVYGYEAALVAIQDQLLAQRRAG